MIVSVVFGENEHIWHVWLHIQIKIEGSLEFPHVPLTNVQSVLLQVGHQMPQTIKVVG